jgi:hypothetical protein
VIRKGKRRKKLRGRKKGQGIRKGGGEEGREIKISSVGKRGGHREMWGE